MTERKIELELDPIIKEAASQWTLVLNMTGYKSWKVRLWLGSLIIRFACWLIGFNFEEDRDVIDLRKAEIIKK